MVFLIFCEIFRIFLERFYLVGRKVFCQVCIGAGHYWCHTALIFTGFCNFIPHPALVGEECVKRLKNRAFPYAIFTNEANKIFATKK